MKVCAVDKDLVIHAMRICCCWHGDKPQQCEPPGQSAPCYPETCGEMVCGFTGQNPVNKNVKVPNLAGVRASINRRCLALRAQPALGSCSCLAVLNQSMAAHVTRRPVPISHRNWLYRISSSFLTTGLGLPGVNFTDQAVGTKSKTRSRHRPRLPQESASGYPHEMSLKPSARHCVTSQSAWERPRK